MLTGLSPNTPCAWKKENDKFLKAYEFAEVYLDDCCVERINTIAEIEPRWALRRLERKRPAEWNLRVIEVRETSSAAINPPKHLTFEFVDICPQDELIMGDIKGSRVG